LCELQLAYDPNGIKTWVNQPVVFPDLKRIQEVQGQGEVLRINIKVGATLQGCGRLEVGYYYESRTEVTLASANPLPEEPPKPAKKPVAPPPAKTTPAPARASTPEVTPQPSPPARASTPEITPKPPVPPVVPTPPQKPRSAEQRFEVYNLGEGVNILQSANKPKGTLSAGGGKLKYQEAGKTVFTVGRGEIREIDANSVLGYNTGTFHVILKSGKTYNFAPASLSIADGQAMLESVMHALP
jgi:hypothetical protein